MNDRELIREQASDIRNYLNSSAWETIKKYFERHLDKRFNSVDKGIDKYTDWQNCKKFYKEVIGDLKTTSEEDQKVNISNKV